MASYLIQPSSQSLCFLPSGTRKGVVDILPSYRYSNMAVALQSLTASELLLFAPKAPTSPPSSPPFDIPADSKVTVKPQTRTTEKELSNLGRNTFTSTIFGNRRRRAWQNPQLSIGTGCTPLGENKCWDTIGPAGDLGRELLPKVKEILNGRYEDLNKGESTPCMLMFGLYMVGRSEAKARPTLIISGDRTRCQRALRYIKDEKLLAKLPEVSLGESRIPPQSKKTPEELAAESESLPLGFNEHGTKKVFCDSKTETTCGIQVVMQWHNAEGTLCQRNATVGCIVYWQGKYLGWTVAHAFSEPPEPKPSLCSDDLDGDIDFAFDEEYTEDSDEHNSESSVPTNSGTFVNSKSFVGANNKKIVAHHIRSKPLKLIRLNHIVCIILKSMNLIFNWRNSDPCSHHLSIMAIIA